MKAVMVMFDSLNRHMLSPYGCDWTHTPNFQRLAEKTCTFDTSYVGSMPCMPARREIHTGRYNFLHRSWGPIEPFDRSMPQILRDSGVHTHLITDHYHYWEDGGATYHNRYSTCELVRGQEGDAWKADLRDEAYAHPESLNDVFRDPNNIMTHNDWINRHYMPNEEDMPMPRTFAGGLEFLKTNAKEDNWFLQLETFDPHEPYMVAQRFLDLYKDIDDWDGPHFDWPPYRAVKPEEKDAARHVRIVNAALHSMCDWYLGKILDAMDELDLWDDTMLIVNTDHGFLLGEHDYWAKCWCPLHEEICHTPLFIWDPRQPETAGARRKSLVQTIDLAPTLLEYFGQTRPAEMIGQPLAQTLTDDAPVREAGLFGVFGHQICVTDGRYSYYRTPPNQDVRLNEYTHMPTHMRGPFSVEEMQKLEELAEPFAFTQGCKTMKIPGRAFQGREQVPWPTVLYDLQNDPTQDNPIDNAEIEQTMCDHIARLFKENDAPPELYDRLDLPRPE